MYICLPGIQKREYENRKSCTPHRTAIRQCFYIRIILTCFFLFDINIVIRIGAGIFKNKRQFKF